MIKILGKTINCTPALPPTATGGGCNITHFIQLIKIVIDFMLTLVVPLAVIFILWGGFVIMTAGGSPDKFKKGRDIITAAVIGVAIAFGSWLIVTAIFKILPVATEFIPK